MVEVFKTNAKDKDQATVLLDHIHKAFIGYKANFDLDDCDKILRIKCTTGSIQSSELITLLKELECHAEVL